MQVDRQSLPTPPPFKPRGIGDHKRNDEMDDHIANDEDNSDYSTIDPSQDLSSLEAIVAKSWEAALGVTGKRVN